MLTLYGVYRSRASRALWLLNETGTPFDHVPVIQAYRLADPAAADAPRNTASPDFLAVNPMGQIPALTDQGLVLTESLAIVLYLAKRYGGALGPKDVAEDALMTNWALFAATAIEPAALTILQAAPQDAGAISAAAAKLDRPLARLDLHLAGRDWLLDRFTAADICVAECLRYAQGHAGLVAAHPAAFAWLARCQARPAFQAMWAARALEPA
jgi:glutathione S-transferase